MKQQMEVLKDMINRTLANMKQERREINHWRGRYMEAVKFILHSCPQVLYARNGIEDDLVEFPERLLRLTDLRAECAEMIADYRHLQSLRRIDEEWEKSKAEQAPEGDK